MSDSPLLRRMFVPLASVTALLLLIFGIAPVMAEDSGNAQVKILPSTNLPSLSQSDSKILGASGGISSGNLVRIGGAAEGGTFVPSVEILDLKSGNAGWKTLPLPGGRVWAATVQHGDEILLAGGLIDGKPSDKVTALSIKDGQLQLRDLPALPSPLVGAGAAMIGEKFHVVGGLSATASNGISRDVLVLDLSASTPTWTKLPQLPGEGKVLPVVTGQYDLLEVIGGRTADGHGGFPASRDVLLYRSKPAEGTTKIGWDKASDAPVALAGGKAVPTGQAHTIVFGVDTTPLASSPLAINTNTSSPALLFHAVTDAWTQVGSPLGSINPSLAKTVDGALYLFGGTGSGNILQVTTPRSSRSLNWADYLMILFYFFFIGYIGYYFRHQKSSAEYSLGNRQTPWWAAGISMFATAASAISFMAVPALAFASNLVWLFPLIVFVPVYFFQSRITYPILRRLEITSTFEYLERRFDTSLRLIASFLQIVFQTFGRSSIVLVLPSIAISATTGLDVRWSVLIMGLLTTVYTSVGGFEAVTWTLVFQGVLKALAPIAVIWICISGLPGGFGEFIHTNASHHKFDFAILGWDVAFPLVWVMMLRVFLEQTIWQAGDQAVIQRVFASKDHEIRKVTAMNFSCGAFIGILVTAMGLAIFAYFHAHPEKFDASSSIDQIVPLFVIQGMPHGAVGIVIAAIFASAMATVAGAMNSVATIFTVDFYERWFPKAEDKANLRMMRLSTIGTGVAATVIALWLTTLNLKSIMVTWNIVSSLLGGGIVGIFALGMFSTRANAGGAVCGAILSIALGLYVKFFTGIHWAFLLPILIFSAMIIGYVCSFFFRKQETDLTGLTIYHLKESPKIP
jgi:solute:Na+ symporter, SSS family